MIAWGTIMKTRIEKQTEKEKAEALLHDLVAAFAKFGGDVEVHSKNSPGGRETLTLRVNADDAPLVQGKWGRVFQALRTIFSTVGAREDRSITVLWSEPTVGQWKETIEDFTRPYKPDDIQALATRLLDALFVERFEVALYDGAPDMSKPEGDKVAVVLEFKVAPSEIDIANALAPFLGLIFSAIGKRQGKDLHLQMTPVIEVPARTL
jgi:predicted RNA-binding protein YlqC (UPF0109 family)